MINWLKTSLLAVVALTAVILAIAPAAWAANSPDFNPLEGACDTNDKTQSSPLCKQAQEQTATGEDPIAGPNGIISKAANIIALVAGIGAVIMILIGGFEFVSAGGTGFKSAVAGAAPTRVAKARSRIASGLIGLVVVALAWTIVRLITDKVLG